MLHGYISVRVGPGDAEDQGARAAASARISTRMKSEVHPHLDDADPLVIKVELEQSKTQSSLISQSQSPQASSRGAPITVT